MGCCFRVMSLRVSRRSTPRPSRQRSRRALTRKRWKWMPPRCRQRPLPSSRRSRSLLSLLTLPQKSPPKSSRRLLTVWSKALRSCSTANATRSICASCQSFIITVSITRYLSLCRSPMLPLSRASTHGKISFSAMSKRAKKVLRLSPRRRSKSSRKRRKSTRRPKSP